VRVPFYAREHIRQETDQGRSRDCANSHKDKHSVFAGESSPLTARSRLGLHERILGPGTKSAKRFLTDAARGLLKACQSPARPGCCLDGTAKLWFDSSTFVIFYGLLSRQNAASHSVLP
jgi:hypothetical protein